MKLIVSSSFVFKYVTEYLDTFEGYIPTTYENLFNHNLAECKELVLVQWSIWQWLPDYVFNLPLKLSIINTEQLTYSEHKSNFIKYITDLESKCGYKVTVYDYSKTNCKVIQENGFISKYHEYVSTKQENDFLKSLITGKYEYDIGFVGGINDRRIYIINELIKLGIKVLVIETWGYERDIQLSKCKYILNIHWNEDYKIFEALRCNRLLQAGIKIISEDSIDIYDNNNLFIFSYDNMVNYTEKILNEN